MRVLRLSETGMCLKHNRNLMVVVNFGHINLKAEKYLFERNCRLQQRLSYVPISASEDLRKTHKWICSVFSCQKSKNFLVWTLSLRQHKVSPKPFKWLDTFLHRYAKCIYRNWEVSSKGVCPCAKWGCLQSLKLLNGSCVFHAFLYWNSGREMALSECPQLLIWPAWTSQFCRLPICIMVMVQWRHVEICCHPNYTIAQISIPLPSSVGCLQLKSPILLSSQVCFGELDFVDFTVLLQDFL